MTADLEARILDAVASMQAEKGSVAAQSDIRVRLLPLPATDAARHAFDDAVAALTPTFLIRGGLPATPMLRLTVKGWLRSSSRPVVEQLVQVFLDTYRALAQQGQLHGRHIRWEDLAASGMALDLLGLLSTAGAELHLFSGGTLPGGSRSGSSVNLELPWDVGELVHISTVADFLEYRRNNPASRVNFFQRLQLRVTGEIRRVVTAIYDRSTAGWPSQRKVEVVLRRNGDSLADALNAGFVFVKGADDLHARVGLTYHGLWLLEKAEAERKVLIKVLHALAKAYSAAPLRSKIDAKALVEADEIDEAELAQALSLLEGQVPPVVVPGSTEQSASLFLAPWLLELRGAKTFDDVIFALDCAAQAEWAASISRNAAVGELAAFPASTESPRSPRGRSEDAWANVSQHAATNDTTESDTKTTNDSWNLDLSAPAGPAGEESNRATKSTKPQVTVQPGTAGKPKTGRGKGKVLQQPKAAADAKAFPATRLAQVVAALVFSIFGGLIYYNRSTEDFIWAGLAIAGLAVVFAIVNSVIKTPTSKFLVYVHVMIIGVLVLSFAAGALFLLSKFFHWPLGQEGVPATNSRSELQEKPASSEPREQFTALGFGATASERWCITRQGSPATTTARAWSRFHPLA